jgi:hypothetical protein
MADGGEADQPAGNSHLICGVAESEGGGAMVEFVGAEAAEVPPRDALTHLRKFSFSAPTRAAFPRIL